MFMTELIVCHKLAQMFSNEGCMHISLLWNNCKFQEIHLSIFYILQSSSLRNYGTLSKINVGFQSCRIHKEAAGKSNQAMCVTMSATY